jgi:predicted transcriptional regulator/DNA-binding Xre family transcriptional regulator/uncharacterized protein YfkK (UPF0435 family)
MVRTINHKVLPEKNLVSSGQTINTIKTEPPKVSDYHSSKSPLFEETSQTKTAGKLNNQICKQVQKANNLTELKEIVQGKYPQQIPTYQQVVFDTLPKLKTETETPVAEDHKIYSGNLEDFQIKFKPLQTLIALMQNNLLSTIKIQCKLQLPKDTAQKLKKDPTKLTAEELKILLKHPILSCDDPDLIFESLTGHFLPEKQLAQVEAKLKEITNTPGSFLPIEGLKKLTELEKQAQAALAKKEKNNEVQAREDIKLLRNILRKYKENPLVDLNKLATKLGITKAYLLRITRLLLTPSSDGEIPEKFQTIILRLSDYVRYHSDEIYCRLEKAELEYSDLKLKTKAFINNSPASLLFIEKIIGLSSNEVKLFCEKETNLPLKTIKRIENLIHNINIYGYIDRDEQSSINELEKRLSIVYNFQEQVLSLKRLGLSKKDIQNLLHNSSFEIPSQYLDKVTSCSNYEQMLEQVSFENILQIVDSKVLTSKKEELLESPASKNAQKMAEMRKIVYQLVRDYEFELAEIANLYGFNPEYFSRCFGPDRCEEQIISSLRIPDNKVEQFAKFLLNPQKISKLKKEREGLIEVKQKVHTKLQELRQEGYSEPQVANICPDVPTRTIKLLLFDPKSNLKLSTPAGRTIYNLLHKALFNKVNLETLSSPKGAAYVQEKEAQMLKENLEQLISEGYLLPDIAEQAGLVPDNVNCLLKGKLKTVTERTFKALKKVIANKQEFLTRKLPSYEEAEILLNNFFEIKEKLNLNNVQLFKKIGLKSFDPIKRLQKIHNTKKYKDAFKSSKSIETYNRIKEFVDSHKILAAMREVVHELVEKYEYRQAEIAELCKLSPGFFGECFGTNRKTLRDPSIDSIKQLTEFLLNPQKISGLKEKREVVIQVKQEVLRKLQELRQEGYSETQIAALCPEVSQRTISFLLFDPNNNLKVSTPAGRTIYNLLHEALFDEANFKTLSSPKGAAYVQEKEAQMLKENLEQLISEGYLLPDIAEQAGLVPDNVNCLLKGKLKTVTERTFKALKKVIANKQEFLTRKLPSYEEAEILLNNFFDIKEKLNLSKVQLFKKIGLKSFDPIKRLQKIHNIKKYKDAFKSSKSIETYNKLKEFVDSHNYVLSPEQDKD